MTDDQFKALSKQIGELLLPIKTIAVVHLVKELYQQSEREQLVAEYCALEVANTEAHDAMIQAQNELNSPPLSFEERVRQFGEKKAKLHLAPVSAAMARKQETSAALTAFRERHRLIAQMLDSKRSLGIFQYEK